MADYLRAGSLILRSVSQDGFEILHAVTDHKGILIASGEVHKAPVPTLHIHKLPPEERLLDMEAAPSARLVLEKWSDATATSYELKAAGTETGIEILLSGHHRYRCYWWRATVAFVDGEVIIRGPHLAADCDS